MLAGNNASSDPEALYLRGVAFFRLGEFPSAETSFRGAIALDASRAHAFYFLGLALERRGVNEDAVKAYRVALSLDDTLTKAREKLTLLGAAVEAAPTASRLTVESVPSAPRPRLESVPSAPRPAVETAPTAPRPKERRPMDTELMLPNEDEEFADYEQRKRKKAVIDTRAQYEGELKGMPAWAKVLTAVFFVYLLGFMAFVSFNLFTKSDIRTNIEMPTGDLPQQGGDIKRQRTEVESAICERALAQGQRLPGCGIGVSNQPPPSPSEGPSHDVKADPGNDEESGTFPNAPVPPQPVPPDPTSPGPKKVVSPGPRESIMRPGPKKIERRTR